MKSRKMNNQEINETQEMESAQLFKQDLKWLEENVCDGSIAEKVHKMIEDYRKCITSKAVEIPKEETQKWGGWQKP